MEPLAALLSLALAGGVLQGPQTAEPLTEERFLAAAFGDGADRAVVAAASLDVGERRADLAASRLRDDPQIAFAGEDPGGDDSELELTVGWRPERPARRRLELDAARAEVEAAEASRDLELALARLEARGSFATWAVAFERLQALDSEAELLTEMTRRLGERVRQGEAAGLDLRRLRLAAVEVDARRAVARAEAARSAAQASVWAPEVVPVPSPSAGRVAPALPDLPDLAGLVPPGDPPADADTPTVRSLEALVRAAEAERRLADLRTELPELVAGWKQVEGPEGSAGVPVIGLAWRVPLADRRTVARERADSRLDVLEARLELARRRGEAEGRGARSAYDELRRATGAADAALEMAPEATEAVRLAFELGETDLTSLLDTVRAATAARLAAADLHGSALEALREVERIRLLGAAPPSPTTTPNTDPGDTP